MPVRRRARRSWSDSRVLKTLQVPGGKKSSHFSFLFFFFFGVHRIPCLVKRACKELVEAWVWDIMNSVDYVEKRPFFFLYQKGQVANKKYYEAL